MTTWRILLWIVVPYVSIAILVLGTIYRYFSSKDHLLVAAMLEWMLELERTVTQRPPSGDSPADRVLLALPEDTTVPEQI